MFIRRIFAVVFIGLGVCKDRNVEDTTPFPCKSTYGDEHIELSATKHLKGSTCDRKDPQLLLLLGGSGAGKGTFLKAIQANGFKRKDFVLHGIDDYLNYLPEYQQTISDPERIYKDAADNCYGGAIKIAKAVQKQLIANRCHTIYEETGKDIDRVLKRVLPPFTDAGFKVTIVLVDMLPSLAKERSYKRFQSSGRHAPDDYIDGTFKNTFENYVKLREQSVVGSSYYCDNTCLLEDGTLDTEHAAKAKVPPYTNCLKCWADSVSGTPAFAEHLPSSALLKGQARYIKDAVRNAEFERLEL